MRPTAGAIPEGVSRYPAICEGSLWLNERKLSVWRVADCMPHRDGNGSVVLARVDYGPRDKAAPDDMLSVSQQWIDENPDFTAIDVRTAERFIRGMPWYRRMATRLARWFER